MQNQPTFTGFTIHNVVCDKENYASKGSIFYNFVFLELFFCLGM